MTEQHPITPPHLLKRQWIEQATRDQSLKQQALARLEFLEKLARACGHDPQSSSIRRALEALPDE